jgi:peptidoglycan hydrolase-like protein with peptidoglycan-binding domain
MGEPIKTDEQAHTIAHRFPFKHTLDVGNSGILVAWAQSKLHEHGQYNGPIDGRYDREVTLAVRKFQESKKLMITGVIDRKTWDAL